MYKITRILRRLGPACGTAEVRLQARARQLPAVRVEGARAGDLLVEQAAAAELLGEALGERAGALVGELLRPDEARDDVARADAPAEPRAREERLREGADLEDDVCAVRPEAAVGLAVEAELAVGDVLDDEEAVPPRELDEGRAPLRRERD